MLQVPRRTLAYVITFVLGIGFGVFATEGLLRESESRTVTITGCLQKGDEANTFALRGQDQENCELVSKTVALKDHVGQRVTVTGRLRGDRRDVDEEPKDAGEGGPSRVQVTRLRMLSTNCP